MRMRRHTLLSAILAIVVATAGFAGGYWMRMGVDAGPTVRGPTVGAQWLASAEEPSRRRPDFEFTDQDEVRRRIADYDGKLVVVNFWATWCPPCLHEIPLFVEYQSRFAERGLQFIGVALDETDSVRQFARRVGLNYPTAVDQQLAFEIMAEYGNRTGGLPFTVFVDRQGDIAFRKVGPVTESELEQLIDSLL